MFLIVQYEDMSLNELMQHRIGSLPAFRIYSQARLSYVYRSGLLLPDAANALRLVLLHLHSCSLVQRSNCDGDSGNDDDDDKFCDDGQGRRFVADGRQNLRDLMDSIEAKTVRVSTSYI